MGFEIRLGRGFLLRERDDQSGQETSFAFPHRGTVTALPAPQPGVEQIPEGVQEQDDHPAEHPEGFLLEQPDEEICKPAPSLGHTFC